MKATPVSRMRDQVTVQSPVRTQDSYGQAVITGWTDVATVWANVEPIAGRETFYGGAVRADVTHGVLMRYYAGLLPSWRLAWSNLGTTKYLNVESALDVESRGREHALQCKEVVQ